MSDECRNDCVKPPRFPRDIHNRPGLAHIDYRIGTYADFRQALIHRLNQDPVLARWTHRQSDDPGIALMEGASILGDILTFYQELYANEAYLRTTQWRESIADLVRLTGYRLSPGLAGKATFAVEVKGDKPVTIPKGFRFKAQLEDMDKPAEFETEKEIVAIPSLSKFNLFKPITYPEIQPASSKDFYIYHPAQKEADIALQKGDRLLVGCPEPRLQPNRLLNAQVIVIDDVKEMHDRKVFRIVGLMKRMGRQEWVVGYKLGRSFRHFGHNAPQKYIWKLDENKVRQENILYLRKFWEETSSIEGFGKDPDGNIGVLIVSPALHQLDLALSESVDNLAIGSSIIVQGRLWGWNYDYNDWVDKEEFTLIREIENYKASSLTWGAMTGASTLVRLNQEFRIHANSNYYCEADIRHLEFHETVSPMLRIRAKWEEIEQDQGRVLEFYGTDNEANLLKGRLLDFENPNGEHFERAVLDFQYRHWDSAKYPNMRRVRLCLDETVDYGDFAVGNQTTTVYGNLVSATQGKTEAEAVLGSGDRRQVFQTFKLPKKPLTYFRSEEEDPPETPELKVYVNDRLWQCVPTFFDRGPNEQVYIVRQDEAGDNWVQFGDGKTGARLPSGLDNVTAVYRTGTGATGPIKEGATARAGMRLEGLRKVHLPGEAFGGADRESGENAKAAAPGKLQSLGRLVTLQDIECEARALPGVVKAAARWDIHLGGAAVVVTLLTQNGPTLTERRELEAILNQANQDRGTRRFPIVVRPGVRHYIYLSVSIGYNSTYKEVLVKEAVKIALGLTGEEEFGIDGGKGLFGIKQRCFGQPEYATRIEGTIQQVKGVIWASVVSIGFLVDDASNPAEWEERAPLAVSTIIRSDCERDEAPEQVLLTLHSPHLRMAFSPVEPTEVGCHG